MWPFKSKTDPMVLEWDAALNAALDTGEIKILSEFKASIGGLEVWIRGWPHNYGEPQFAGAPCVVPLIETRERLRREVFRAALAQEQAR